MTTYRKRGTEVDAFQWDGALGTGDPAWFKEGMTLGKIRRVCPGVIAQLLLDPPGGKGYKANPLVANVGDWIVRNARGDVFPLTSEKFAETYEAIPVDRLDDWSRRTLEAASGE